MANHVSNRLHFESTNDDWDAEESAFSHLVSLMKTDKSPFDFNALLPSLENSELEEITLEVELASVSWNKHPKDELPWHVQNWGTKWDAYAIVVDEDFITFATAWSTPWPIWEALAEHFKDMQNIQLVIEYADEDAGGNCGIAVYEGGKQLYHRQAQDMPDPVSFARAIVFEHRANVYEYELVEARKKIQELEKQLKAVHDRSETDNK